MGAFAANGMCRAGVVLFHSRLSNDVCQHPLAIVRLINRPIVRWYVCFGILEECVEDQALLLLVIMDNPRSILRIGPGEPDHHWARIKKCTVDKAKRVLHVVSNGRPKARVVHVNTRHADFRDPDRKTECFSQSQNRWAKRTFLPVKNGCVWRSLPIGMVA